MKTKTDSSVRLYRSTIQKAITQLLAVGICSAVLCLFAALTYSRITLPRYTANYDQKDTQQVVNLLITVVATVIGILLSHCRRLTNEAETKSELHHEELTIPRLHVHFEAAGGSKAAMGLPVLHNVEVRSLVAFYFIAMVVFGFLHSVLSVIFVVDAVISEKGEPMPIQIPMSVDVPEEWDGQVVDPCVTSISAPGCEYDLAINTLASQLITYTPYTVGGVTFEPPNGTMGLPYYAMDHFSKQVATSPFEEEYRQYCLPVLHPHVIKCTEVPFDQGSDHTIHEPLAKFTPLNISKLNAEGQLVPIHNPNHEIQEVAIDYDLGEQSQVKCRTNDEGQGTMMIKMSTRNHFTNTTIIAASNDRGHGYASLFYHLMYGVDPDWPKNPAVGYKFVAKCEIASIKFRTDNLHSSWRKVDFTLKGGVLRANVTEELCPNARADLGFSGFGDLYFDLEGAGEILASTDGYSKVFNRNQPAGNGTSIYENMSRLDAVVNQMYALTQTAWSQSSYKYSMLNPNVTNLPITMLSYPHLYVIRINWTPTTYIGLILSLLITLNAWILAARWVRATYRSGFGAESWNLLRPVDLMAYSLAAYKELLYDLNTVEHRRMTMRGQTRTVLRERPVWQGTSSLIGLVKRSSVVQTGVSPTSTGSPASTSGGRNSASSVKSGGPSAMVERKDEDLERCT